MTKEYFQLKLKALSPLRLGGGSENSDSDILCNAAGTPFLPGSSIAGVLRSSLAQPKGEIANQLFGYIDGNHLKASALLVNDGILSNRKGFTITVRDGVRIDPDTGTAEDTGKFDFEVAELSHGSHFVSVLELGDHTEKAGALLEELLSRILRDGLHLGAKTTRGYGEFKVTIRRRSFDLDTQLREWLDFDPFDEKNFGGTLMEPLSDAQDTVPMTALRLKLKNKGTFIVRKPTGNETVELREKKTLKVGARTLQNMAGNPVIPGTSWAGVFRHRMLHILKDLGGEYDTAEQRNAINALFGMMTDNKDHRRSVLTFSETVIEGGELQFVTRTAIDRFTGGARDTALYTEQVCCGGTGELVIRYPEGKLSDFHTQLLLAAVDDLKNGLLTVGGEAGTGRGIFSVEQEENQ